MADTPTDANSPIDARALSSLSVAPAEDTGSDRREQADAGSDKSISKRLEKNPANQDAHLDNALDESMDASDPLSPSHPGARDPAPSSGFDAEAERQRDA